MYHPLGFLIFRDSKAGMGPSTLGMCRYISHSEIVCRGPKSLRTPGLHCSALLPLCPTCYSCCLIHLDVFAKLRKACTSFAISVCLSAWNNSAPSGRIIMKFDIWVFFENMSRTFKFHSYLIRIRGTLHEDIWTFMTCRWTLLVIRNIKDGRCRENQNTRLIFNNIYIYIYRKSCCLWDNVEK
jgi:hypothetical protein